MKIKNRNIYNNKLSILIILILFFFNPNIFLSGWSEQISGFSNNLQGVSTINNDVGWICGRNGLVLRTTNGGISWINVGNQSPFDSLDLFSIYAINERIAFVTYSSNQTTYLYKTSNAGTNWITVFTQTGGYIDHFAFKDTVNGFLLADPVGGRWSLWRSSDQGFTWDSSGLYLPTNDIGSFNKDLVVQGDSIFFGSHDSQIFYSYNFGNNWNYSNGGCPFILTLAINGNIGFAAEGCAYKTSNAGINWNPVSLHYYQFISCFANVNNQFWYSSLDSIYYSSDGGNSFNLQYSPNTAGDVYWQISLVKSNNQTVGWAITNLGKISKYSAPIGIKPISSDIPNKFELYQNYPNPFNPSTTINYQLPKAGQVKLVIYDLLGKEVTTLLNEQQQPGKYQVTWDASNFASGVYFYKIVVSPAFSGVNSAEPQSQSYTQIKKMVLVK